MHLARVHVVGSSCAGKTTFARRLAAKLGVKYIELDSLHWEPNWKEAELETFRDRVREAASSDSWVADGDYSRKIGDLVQVARDDDHLARPDFRNNSLALVSSIISARLHSRTTLERLPRKSLQQFTGEKLVAGVDRPKPKIQASETLATARPPA